jgi:AcrR family transcriptional regulator
VNTAGLCYHFGSKEGLYEEVVSEAGRQLAAAGEDIGNRLVNAAPEAKLYYAVESLSQKLSEEQAWIAKLLARELVAPRGDNGGALSAGVGGYYVLLHAAIYELLGAQADRQLVHLHTLSVIGQCVFYCLAAKNLRRAFPQLPGPLPTQEKLARHVASVSLEALRQQIRSRDYELNPSR